MFASVIVTLPPEKDLVCRSTDVVVSDIGAGVAKTAREELMLLGIDRNGIYEADG
jgi:hypothetical protein